MGKHIKMNRRDLLKGLAVLPALGVFGFSFAQKRRYDAVKSREQRELLADLGLDFTDEFSPLQPGYSGEKNDRLRIGIIGLGSRGMQLMHALGYATKDWIDEHTDASGKPDNALSAFFAQQNMNVSVTAVCDVFDLNLQQGTEASAYDRENNDYTENPARGYADYRKLLEDKDVDAVIVATPDFHHTQMAKDAILAGMDVYCEKSMAHTVKEALTLLDTVRASKKVFQVGHQYLQNDIFPRAKGLIRNNKLGKITMVEATSNRNSYDGAWVRHLYADGTPKPGDSGSIDWKLWLGDAPDVPFSKERYYNWTLWWDYGNGVISQLMSHEFDIANQMLELGIPESVTAEGGIFYYKDGREIPDILNVVCNYPEKDFSFLYSVSLASSRERGRVFMGHDASMELNYSLKYTIDRESTQYSGYIKDQRIKPDNVLFEYKPGSGSVDAFASATEQYYASRGLAYTIRNGTQVDSTHLHVREWLDCIRSGNSPSCGIERGFEESIACIMAAKSYREMRRVRWDSVHRKII